MQITQRFRDRSRAGGIHLVASIFIAALAAAWVFLVLYPYPFREISGGRDMFGVLVGVDVVVGPLLTWLVFDRRKPASELRRDLATIALVQLLALGYGLWSMYEARPVYLVHEVDRFVVVSAADIDPADLPSASPEFRRVPRLGIRTIGLREPIDTQEKVKALELSLVGKDLSLQPRFWQALSSQNRETIRKGAKPLDELGMRTTEARPVVDEWAAAHPGKAADYLVYPMVARSNFWSVVLDRDLNMVGYLPIDPF